MNPFPVKANTLSGTSERELLKKARNYFKLIEGNTKRQTYVRSAYFNKQKVFFTYFWNHLFQKTPKRRRIRLKYLPCAIELIEKSRNAPTTKVNPNKLSELLHRFHGITNDRKSFYVQIKENSNTKRKELMSIVVPED